MTDGRTEQRRRGMLLLVSGASLVLAAAAEACVGEDPPFQPGPQTDAGSASSTTGAVGSSSSSSSSSSSGASGSTSSSSGAPIDAGPDGSSSGLPCDRTKGFGPAEPLDALNPLNDTYSVTSLRFSQHGFYFSSDLADASPTGDSLASLDLYAVDRGANGTLGAPRKLTGISQGGVEDLSPTESPDRMLLLYTSGDSDSRRLRRALRSAADVTSNADYGSSKTLAPPLIRSTSTRETDPYFAGSRLYFAAADGDAATGTLSIYSVSVDAAGAAQNDLVKALPLLVGFAGDIRSPVVAEDESELFFSHAEAPAGEPIGQVLYRATPSGLPSTFGNPTKVFATPPGLYVSASELSRDACDLYLSVRGAGGRFKVFVAHRARP